MCAFWRSSRWVRWLGGVLQFSVMAGRCTPRVTCRPPALTRSDPPPPKPAAGDWCGHAATRGAGGGEPRHAARAHGCATAAGDVPGGGQGGWSVTPYGLPLHSPPACLPCLPPAPRHAAEGVHSREAIDMVKEHVLAVLGPASVAFSNTQIRMSKLQAAQVGGVVGCLRCPAVVDLWSVYGGAEEGATGPPSLARPPHPRPLPPIPPPPSQVYAASIMFGYFLRRVDTRFQLARQVGCCCACCATAAAHGGRDRLPQVPSPRPPPSLPTTAALPPRTPAPPRSWTCFRRAPRMLWRASSASSTLPPRWRLQQTPTLRPRWTHPAPAAPRPAAAAAAAPLSSSRGWCRAPRARCGGMLSRLIRRP